MGRQNTARAPGFGFGRTTCYTRTHSLLEQRAAAVTFIRPHPLWLVSVGNRSSGNIFTMNLMEHLGNGYFGFALRHLRVAADLAERAGWIAVSGIPLTRCTLAF